VPNLLIGLREGLEGGLVVSILLAALRKTTPRPSSTPVWLGVLGAVALAGSFAAVLTYSTGVLSSRWQEAIGGLLSVLAVGLVTGMIFWMRRTGASLSADLRERVAAALGAGALALTAFLAVGREGLETTLFLWTAVRASGQTAAPLIGAALGLAVAVLLCVLLFRRAIRLNLGVFFNRTALALIVIAAGVLAYGLGDLQDAGLLTGHAWMAFDLSGHVDATSWWMSIITGVTELSPRMTVLQVVAWAGYLAVVIPVFLRAGVRPVAQVRRSPTELGRRSKWALAGGLVVVPVAAAGTAIALLPASVASATTAVTVRRTACAPQWHAGHTGMQTFEVTNDSGKAGEINLDDAAGAVVAEIETLGPATTAPMTATLAPGSYTFTCLLPGQAAISSAPVQVSGAAVAAAPPAVTPVTVEQLQPATIAYRRYVAPKLVTLAGQVAAIQADLRRGALAAARTDWLPAQLSWEQVGAAYGSFGDLGDAIDGLPQGLPEGVADPSFTGLHRLEYGLWHAQSAGTLIPVTGALITDVGELRRELPAITVAPTDLPVRAHEILEDAQRDHLTGMTDEGAGAAYRETEADVQGTRVVLGELEPLITARSPQLVATVDTQLGTLQSALAATGWRPLGATPAAAREDVDAALGAVLESLSAVPDLLEVPPSR
jgi:high-affinity iron transporter